MKRGILVCSLFASLTALHGEDLLDRVDEVLTISAFDDAVRTRLSGTLDLEYFHLSRPPFGLINGDVHDLFNPRLTLFLDTQIGPHVYAYAQARLDRGYDPAPDAAQVRLDEYAIRVTPWEDARFNLQIGKFSTVIGSWIARHLSWDNPFVTAPLPYSQLTGISDSETPGSTAEFTQPHAPGTSYEYNPIIWDASYTSGASVSGLLGKFEYAAEIKNSAPSSRPEAWDATATDFDHPTVNVRLGWRPNAAWNLGVSASRGPYLGAEAAPSLPPGRGIGDYQQFLLGQDISFAWRHFQIWTEFYEARFEVPHVGNAETFAWYIESKYKFTPEFFAALRWNQQFYATVPDGLGGETQWGRDVWRADAALGYRFSAHTQLKLQYSLENERGTQGHSHVLAAQFTVRF